MITVKDELIAALSRVLEDFSPGSGGMARLESPKVPEHGDYAMTSAMQLAKLLRSPPRAIAESLRMKLLAEPAFERWVASLEIAGAGFLNVRLHPAAKQQVLRSIFQKGASFGHRPSCGKRLMVEFVSANPTGPLHVGHARQAALGDAICNLYATQGWQVHREFYYNDAGAQIDALARSTQLRAQGVHPGDERWPIDTDDPLTKDLYRGQYIADIARDFLDCKTVVSDGVACIASGDVNDLDGIRRFAVAYLRREQDLDLQAFGLHFDLYFLESSLYSTGQVAQTVERLQRAGVTYEQDGALWLRTTRYGDDKDRVMRKSDGSYTYFVPDVAYHINKWNRGFEKVINIQGTDHFGTIGRVRAGLQAAEVGIPEGFPDYVLHTMVKVIRGGQEVKISKRAGSYVTLRDLVDWTSADAVRFFLLSRKPDTPYVFDVDLAIAQNNDNPVFYVQYAHARICSVLAAWGGDVDVLPTVDLVALDSTPALDLLQCLAGYPDVLRGAAEHFAPHDVVFYLRDLAARYHSYYDAERILVDDESVRHARLALIAATAQVLRNGLAVLGVGAPTRM